MFERLRRWLNGQAATDEMDPTRAMQLYERGVRSFTREDWRSAEREFTAAIHMSPPIAGMYHHRGSVFAEQGKYLEAIADYDIAIRLQPDYPDIYLV